MTGEALGRADRAPDGPTEPGAPPAVGRPWRRGVLVEHLDPVPVELDAEHDDPPSGTRDVAGHAGHGPSGSGHDPELERVALRHRARWAIAAAHAAGIELAALYVALLAGWLEHPTRTTMSALALLAAGLFVVLLGWAFLRQPPPRPISAGTRRLRAGGPRRPTVTLDRLTSIELYLIDAAPHLRLSDAEHTVVIHVGLAQANPALWALVHEGITRSVAAGARADTPTRRQLGLAAPEGTSSQ